MITYNTGSKATTVDESRVVLAEYLPIDTEPKARRDEDEIWCGVHRARSNPTVRTVAK